MAKFFPRSRHTKLQSIGIITLSNYKNAIIQSCKTTIAWRIFVASKMSSTNRYSRLSSESKVWDGINCKRNYFASLSFYHIPKTNLILFYMEIFSYISHAMEVGGWGLGVLATFFGQFFPKPQINVYHVKNFLGMSLNYVMSLFFPDFITLWQMFGLPWKVPDTLRKAIMPKQEQIFEFIFMPLKLKIV